MKVTFEFGDLILTLTRQERGVCTLSASMPITDDIVSPRARGTIQHRVQAEVRMSPTSIKALIQALELMGA